MVRFFLFFLCSFRLYSADPADPTSVNTEVQWENIYENQPIDGFITVTHDHQFKVDDKSFTLNGKPLKVIFDKEVKFSPTSPLILSIYKFTVPGMPRGIQMLSEISVKVNGKIYKSPPISFQVQGLDKQLSSTEPSLKLETVVMNKEGLYPGSRTQVGYRYLYNTNIELTAEYLPLLDPEHFKKLGDKNIKDMQIGLVTVHTILQNIEAKQPGSFTYGASIIEGNAYQEQGGRKTYLQPKLVAEAPAITIAVKDFPEIGKPASFNGAVGKYRLDVALESADQIRLGDIMKLRLAISGDGQLDNIKFPDLCCQPGFSGNFKTSDLPQSGKIAGNTKTFSMDIYPLTTETASLPSIEFSFFNPATEKYETSISHKVPIHVLPAPREKEIAQISMQETAIQPIKEIYALQKKDFKNSWLSSFWVFGLIPSGLTAIFFQYALRQDKKIQ